MASGSISANLALDIVGERKDTALPKQQAEKHESGKSYNSSSNRRTSPSQQPVPVIDNNHYDTQNIENGIATNMVSEGLEEMLASASKAIKLKKTATICFWIH